MEVTAKKQVCGALKGRTIPGMVFEMQSHYYGYLFGLKLKNTEITHMGSNKADSIGYDNNADWFEHPIRNIPDIIWSLIW